MLRFRVQTTAHPGNPDGPRARTRTGNRAMIQSARLASEQARIEAMLDGLYHLALNAEDQNTQIAACNVYLNRVESPPRTMTEIAAVCGAREPSGIRVRFVET